MDISHLIEKYSLSDFTSVKRINPSAYWDEVKLADVMTVTDLDWLTNNFTSFSLKNYTSLEDLDLTGVPCDLMCDDFFKSKSLKDLTKLGGKIKLKKSFCELSALRKLKFIAVHVTSLPRLFGNLNMLEELWLCDTLIKKLPESFSNLTSLTKLSIYPKLINIDAGFPMNLEEADLRGNKLSTIPESLLSLPKLKNLDISDNPFDQLPETTNNSLESLRLARTPFGIFKCNISKLRELYPNCKVEEPVAYADDKTLYLSSTKLYYSAKYLKGHYSNH